MGSLDALQIEPVRVLYVEDDPKHAEMIRELLAIEPRIALETVPRLRMALDIVAKRPPDLILLDLVLPDSDQTTTVPRMIERAAGVPVVVISGMPDVEEQERRALLAGAIGYIEKSGFGTKEKRAALCQRILAWAEKSRGRRHEYEDLDADIRMVAERLRHIEHLAQELRCTHMSDCPRYRPMGQTAGA